MRSVFKKIFLIHVILICTVFVTSEDLGLIFEHGKAGAMYEPGEKITWVIKAGNLKTEAAKKVKYTVMRSGVKLITEGDADLSQGPCTVTCEVNEPASVILTVTVGSRHQCSGALIAAKDIKPSKPKPDDFDQFWKDKLADQEKVPMNPKLTPEKSNVKEVETWLITLDTIKGQKIRGRLAKPVGEKKYPAILKVQYAGVYGLNPLWASNEAKNGFLTLNIIAHDIPVDKDAKFYENLKSGELKSYPAIGNTDRETSYFLRMCLACSRSVDFLASHPNWDGVNIIVEGASQGGYQGIVAAGLNEKVTGVIIRVPAGCDQTGPIANRARSWPYWISINEKNKEKIKACQYYDGINFAYQIKCPVLVGFGFGDETSRAEGVMAAINVMKGPVEIHSEPDQEHKGKYRSFGDRSSAWRAAIAAGKPFSLKSK